MEALKWTSLGPRPGALAPPPRSGCQLALHADGGTLFLYGGYRKEPGAGAGGPPAGAPSTAGGPPVDAETGVVLNDCWALSLETCTWERVKRAGIAPGPRAGFAMAVHRSRAVFFGGVVDHETKGGDVIVSEFYNELYSFAMDTRRWFPLTLRGGAAAAAAAGSAAAAAAAGDASAPAAAAAAPAAAAAAPAAPAPAASAAAHRAAARIQAAFRGFAVRKVLRVYRIGGAVGEMLYAPALGFAPPRAGPAPFGRIGAALAVVGNVLWLYGGLVEVGDVEITFDDVWALDLRSLGGWECVHAGSVTREQLRAAAEAEAGGGGSSDGEWATDDEDE